LTRYLITGGAGFIGSNIADALLAQGLTVRIADNFSTGKRSNIASIRDQVELLEGDLSSLDFARYAVQDVDYVLHQAAIPSVPRSLADPIGNNRAGVEATLNVLLAARDAGVKRLTFASSSSIYGDVTDPELQRQPKHEDMVLQPLSPYGVSKLAAEQYCLVFYQAYGFEAVPLRYFNVFGPRQDPTSEYSAVIPKFITAMLAGKAPTIYGDGEQTRDFTYIDNIVAANLFALHTPGVAGRAYNAALGQPISLNQLVSELNAILGTHIIAHHAEARKGDIKHSCADVQKILRAGFTPVLGFTQGLQKAVAWYRQAALNQA
jgi:nucleoside-diphosphate-sugar epimerase